MPLQKSTQDFIENQIKYYVSQASSYRDIANEYSTNTNSVSDAAFGIIVGCIYSGFLQIYTNQNERPPIEDIQEFHKIMKKQAPLIKKALSK